MKRLLKIVLGLALALALIAVGVVIGPHLPLSAVAKRQPVLIPTEKTAQLERGEKYAGVTLTGAESVSELLPEWLKLDINFVTFQASNGNGPIVWLFIPYGGSEEFSYGGKRFRVFDVYEGSCSLELIKEGLSEIKLVKAVPNRPQ